MRFAHRHLVGEVRVHWTLRSFHFTVLAAAVILSVSVVLTRANILDDVWDFLTGDSAPDLASAHPGTCDDYADTAVFNFKSETEKDCPLGGPRYSDNRSAHYWWCMGQTFETVNAEKAARQGEVDACTGSADRCRDYSRNAAQAVRDNFKFHCGQGGARWRDNQREHYLWCQNQALAGDLSLVNSEESERTQAVNHCKARFNDKAIEDCEAYAARAAANAEIFRDLKCDPEQSRTNGRWFRGADFHFAWCILPENARFRDGEDKARIAEVKECQDRGGGEKKLTPIPSTGPSPFGSSKALPPNQLVPDQKSLKKDATQVKKVLPASGGGFDKVKQDDSKGGSAAMDRLGGDSTPPSGNSGTTLRDGNASGARSPVGAGPSATQKSSDGISAPVFVPKPDVKVDFGIARPPSDKFVPPK